VDAVWFPPNVWPDEVPELRAVVTRYTEAMRRVADDLLELCAGALGVPSGTLTSLATNPTWTFNINRYPPLTEVGEPWQAAPSDPDALTVNIGDLLAHRTGLRWSSGRHRVLLPQAAHPDEELMSLVFFYELDHDAVVAPLAPPVGRQAGLDPVVTAPFIRERIDAISVG
jgi:isopenicillin N synthase-like dioxygenase